MQPQPNHLPPVSAHPNDEPSRCGGRDEQIPFHIPPLLEQAQQAFARDLSRLLQERPGQWVAYSGERQIGFARTQTELYRECLRQGFRRGEFLIRSIEPEPGVMSVDLRPLN
jgi:hypothetical protein